MKRFLFIFILSLVATMFISIFAWGEAIIRFWNFWPEKWMKVVVEEFEKQNPNIKVQLERIPWDKGFDKIATAFTSGDTPDVLELGSTWVAQFAADGALKEVKVADMLDKYMMWDPVIYKGKYYGYPWVISTRILFYNKDLFKKAGLGPENPPKTWTELKKAAMLIDALDKDIYGFGIKTGQYTTWQTFLPFAWSNGGSILSKDWKSANVNSKEFIEALAYVKSLTKYSMIDTNLNIRQAFMQGKIGIILDDVGKIAKFKKDVPKLNFGYAIFVKPDKPDAKPIQFGGAEVVVVPHNTKNPEAAEKFARFVVKKESAMAISSRISTLLPADKSVLTDEFFLKKPGFDVVLKQLKYTKTPPAHPKWVDLQEILTKYITKVYTGTIEPQEAMDKAKQEMDEILSEFEEEGK